MGLAKRKRKSPKEVNRILLLGPIPVVENTWPDEIEKWDFDLTYQLIRHTDPLTREMQLHADADIFAINFEMLYWLAQKEYIWFWKTCDVLIIDELTKCKITKSTPFRVLRGRREWFNQRIGLTGTLLPESYVDLYGQFTVIQKIWDTKEKFLDKYFEDESHNPKYSKWVLKSKKAKKKLRKAIAPFQFTLRSEDYLDVPEWSVQDYWFDLSPKQRKYYDQFEREMYLQFDGDEDLVRDYLLDPNDDDSLDAVADTTSSMRMKLRQCISGFMYNEHGEPLIFDSTKLKYTDKVLKEIDEPALLMYQLIEERRQLIDEFEAPLLKGRKTIQAWNNQELLRSVGHPASMGHGLNLQDGGRVLLFYSLPRSHEHYAQTIARLVRKGQTENVVAIRVLARNTIDELIVKEMEQKQNEQADFAKHFAATNRN